MNSIQKREFKKGIMNIVDLVFAFCHFIIIIFPLIIVPNNLALIIIGIAISGVLLFSIIFNSVKKNPFYSSYVFALLIGNFLFLIPSIILVPLTSIFLIPEICYIIFLSWKTRIIATTKFYGASSYIRGVRVALREGQQSEQVEKQYNAKQHNIISFISLIVLVVVFIIWYDPSLLYG